MSMLFGGGPKTQSVDTSARVRQDDLDAKHEARRTKQQLARMNKGPGGTLLTGPLGISGPAPTLKPSLGAA